MIHADHLHKTYKTDATSLQVLRGVSLTIGDGEFVAITGSSGAGKSTLLHLLAGLDVPTHGQVRWDGRSISSMGDRERAQFRNKMVGFVFQFYYLLPELTALENVLLPGMLANGSRRALKERALGLLREVGLADRAGHRPRQLSGGELQRVAIARALVNQPKVLFCDEPTGNLDSKTGHQIADLLVRMHRDSGASLVLVTHERALAELAERWLALSDGQLVSEVRPGGAKGADDEPRPAAAGSGSSRGTKGKGRG
jgi:predicted ABC-type transport system involved in lysophospholipase L1 biosynthesis ATPase subunit